MSSYKIGEFKRRRSATQNLVRVVLFIIALVLVWFGARKIIFKNVTDLPLAASATIYNTFLPKHRLVNKITELQTTLDSYNAELLTAKLATKENDELKAELGRTPRPTGVLAHVVTLPNRSFYDTFVIDAGSDQGIKVDQVIYAFNSIALGTVSAVESNSAKVTLFSAPGRNTTGTSAGSDVAVTLIGRGGGEYEVRLPRDIVFEINGLISYQSVHTEILVQIERIATDPRDPFQRLIAKAPVNLQALKWVIVR